MDGPSGTETQRTEHAMMVGWGYFARTLGLAERLRQGVVIPRHHENVPGGDLILQFGLLPLAGSPELQDLEEGPRPLAKDQAVAAAWNPRFAHHTSVSRALYQATDETVAQTVTVLDQVSQPFIAQEVAALALQGAPLVLHADLSGREVSAYSTSYPEARWGHMGNGVALGHQHALITLQGRAYRLHLAGFLHPGDTVAEQCLRELIAAAERRLGCRPRRRPELVQRRIAALQEQQHELRCALDRQGQHWQAERARQQGLEERLAGQEEVLAALTARQQDQPLRPHGRLAKAGQQKGAWQKQLARSQRRLASLQEKMARYRQKSDLLTQEIECLQQRQAELEADNAANPNPVPLRIGLDGGFSGGDNLTCLIELGYDFLAVGKGTSALALRREVPAPASWTPVTANARLWEAAVATVGRCPYPLRRIVQHWQGGDKQRYSVFLQYPADAAMPLPTVFTVYHQRQTVEAAVKQGKSVFPSRGIRVRSAAGLELLNQFAFVFWPNFVHWATDWLRPRVRQTHPAFEAALRTVKTQVRVGAQTPATVYTTPGSRVLTFGEEGPYPGVHLELEGIYAFQLPLPLFQCPEAQSPVPRSPRRLLSPPDG